MSDHIDWECVIRIDPTLEAERMSAWHHVPDFAYCSRSHRRAAGALIMQYQRGTLVGGDRSDGPSEPLPFPTAEQVDRVLAAGFKPHGFFRRSEAGWGAITPHGSFVKHTTGRNGDVDKDVRKLIQSITPIKGVRVEAGSQHIKVLKDERLITTLPNTPSDHRWRRNAVAELRRAGITPGEPKGKLVGIDVEITEEQLKAELAAEFATKRGVMARFTRFTLEEVSPMLGIPHGWPTYDAAVQFIRTYAKGEHKHPLPEKRYLLISEALRMWRQKHRSVARAAAANGNGQTEPTPQQATLAALLEQADAGKAGGTPQAQQVHVVLDVAVLNKLLAPLGVELRLGDQG